MTSRECDLTNTSYFNLSGGPTIEGTECVLTTNKHQVVDDKAIPLGPIEDYPGVEADKPFILGAQEPDIDHCFVVDPGNTSLTPDLRQKSPTKLVSLTHPATNLHLDSFSTEPAIQFYTGKFIYCDATDDTPARGPRSGMCIEPSRYINAVNVPEWRNQVILRKGQLWGTKNVYKAWKA